MDDDPDQAQHLDVDVAAQFSAGWQLVEASQDFVTARRAVYVVSGSSCSECTSLP